MSPDSFLTAIKLQGWHGYLEEEPDSAVPWQTRIVVASQRVPGKGYSGISFWVAKNNSLWIVGTWGGKMYVISDESSALALCNDWLSSKERDAAFDIPTEIKLQHNLHLTTE